MSAARRTSASGRARSLRRWGARPGLVLWPLLIAVLLVSSLVIFWLVDPVATDLPSRVLDELGAALLGASIVAISAGFGYYLTQTRERQRRRERRDAALRIQSAATVGEFRIGGMVIPSTVVLQASQPGTPYTDRVAVKFEKWTGSDAKRFGMGDRAEEWRDVFAQRVQRIQEDRKASGTVFTNDDGVDVIEARIDDRGRATDSKLTYTLTWTPVAYHDWAVTSNALDEPLSESESAALATLLDGKTDIGRDLRSVMANPRVRNLAALSHVNSRWPAKLGAGVTVVTADGLVLISARSAGTFVASDSEGSRGGRVKVHVVAEGVEPHDLEGEGDTPMRTAYRAVRQEYGLDIGGLDDIVPAALFIDTQRLQPCFAYVAYAQGTAEEIVGALSCASEAWEADEVMGLPLDDESEALIQLLCDTHDQYVLASNHAKAYLYFAMQTQLGYEHMRHLLRDAKTDRAESPRD